MSHTIERFANVCRPQDGWVRPFPRSLGGSIETHVVVRFLFLHIRITICDDLCTQHVFLKSNVMCWLHTLSHVLLAFLRHTFLLTPHVFDLCRSPTWKREALDPRLLCELMRHFECSEVRRYFWASKWLILGRCIVLWTAQLECMETQHDFLSDFVCMYKSCSVSCCTLWVMWKTNNSFRHFGLVVTVQAFEGCNFQWSVSVWSNVVQRTSEKIIVIPSVLRSSNGPTAFFLVLGRFPKHIAFGNASLQPLQVWTQPKWVRHPFRAELNLQHSVQTLHGCMVDQASLIYIDLIWFNWFKFPNTVDRLFFSQHLLQR